MSLFVSTNPNINNPQLTSINEIVDANPVFTNDIPTILFGPFYGFSRFSYVEPGTTVTLNFSAGSVNVTTRYYIDTQSVPVNSTVNTQQRETGTANEDENSFFVKSGRTLITLFTEETRDRMQCTNETEFVIEIGLEYGSGLLLPAPGSAGIQDVNIVGRAQNVSMD